MSLRYLSNQEIAYLMRPDERGTFPQSAARNMSFDSSGGGVSNDVDDSATGEGITGDTDVCVVKNVDSIAICPTCMYREPDWMILLCFVLF